MTPADRTQFIQAADAFLLVCQDDDAKRQASERLLNVLVDLWQANGPAVYDYRVYPDKLIERVD